MSLEELPITTLREIIPRAAVSAYLGGSRAVESHTASSDIDIFGIVTEQYKFQEKMHSIMSSHNKPK